MQNKRINKKERKCRHWQKEKMKDNENMGFMPKKIDIESMRERKKRDGITLDVAYPEVAKQLHPTKNGTLTANQIPKRWGKKVWWICDKGHEYEAVVSSRTGNTGGTGCPYCANIKILPGYNDLATTNPDIASEWNYAKNEGLKPNLVFAGSSKKMWWICDNGHEYEAAINSRKVHGCPICAGRRVLAGFNDLATLRPDLANEWHPTKNKVFPNALTISCDTKVWWICDKGHEYETSVKDRTRGGGCPICSNRKVVSGVNDLSTTHPHVAILWDYTKNIDYDIKTITFGMKHSVWWKCNTCGHEWKRQVVQMASKNSQCPNCLKNAPVQPLSVSHPELAKEWHPTKNIGFKNKKGEDASTPDVVTRGSSQKVWWLGNCGHEWQATIDNRVNNCKCPYCTNRKVLAGFNDLATKNPDIAKQWHPIKNGNLKPTDVFEKDNRSVWWLGECGHEWQTKISTRSTCGCPICSGKQILVGYNDLATIYPNLAAEWHPIKNGTLQPMDITYGNASKAWWLGQCGHEWEAKISCRRHGNGCPICAGRQVLPGFNDLATTHPDVTKTWHPTKNGSLNPTDVSYGQNKDVWWLCSDGHEWKSKISVRCKNGCPICSNFLIVPGINDLTTTNPELALEWHPTKNGTLKPTDVTYGSQKYAWWKCKEGHEWKCMISSRAKDGNGCPICSESRGEKSVRSVLKNLQIDFKEQYVFNDRFFNIKGRLKDDFAILKNHKVVATIEYHGEQHYRPIDFAGKGELWAKEQLIINQARDTTKTEYLQAHNIPQLIIPYWEYDNIATLVQNFISTL